MKTEHDHRDRIQEKDIASDEEQQKYGMFLEIARRPEGLSKFEKHMVDRWREEAGLSDEEIMDILAVW